MSQAAQDRERQAAEPGHGVCKQANFIDRVVHPGGEIVKSKLSIQTFIETMSDQGVEVLSLFPVVNSSQVVGRSLCFGRKRQLRCGFLGGGTFWSTTTIALVFPLPSPIWSKDNNRKMFVFIREILRQNIWNLFTDCRAQRSKTKPKSQPDGDARPPTATCAVGKGFGSARRKASQKGGYPSG